MRVFSSRPIALYAYSILDSSFIIEEVFLYFALFYVIKISLFFRVGDLEKLSGDSTELLKYVMNMDSV